MRRSRRRAGFTMIELLTVFALVSLIMVMSYRPITRTFSRNERANAKRKVAAFIFRARATAVHRGAKTWFVRDGDVMKVLVDSSGTRVVVGVPVNLKLAHNVAFSSSPLDTIEFDPRGFATNIVANENYTLTRDGVRDTVCITGLGRVRTKAC